ncbi:MAG: DoxX family protein [Betaproteobacteria bacterium]
MAIDRQGLGLTVVRILIGVFFLCEGLGKLRWFGTSSLLAAQLAAWARQVAPGTVSSWYLHRVAMRGAPLFARLVPLGELGCGLALIAGAWTRPVALIAFLMALNFHVASGDLFHYSFLTNGYGLPVLGATLGVAIGGTRGNWRIRN